MRNEEAWIAGAVEALAGGADVCSAPNHGAPRPKSRTRSAGATAGAPTTTCQPQPNLIPAAIVATSTRPGLPQEAPLPGHRQADTHFLGAGQSISRAVRRESPIGHPPAKTHRSGRRRPDTHCVSATPTPSDEDRPRSDNQKTSALIGTIVEQHRRRWDLIRARQRLELQAQAVCRRLNDGDKAKAAKLWAAVKKDPAHELRAWLGPWLMAMEPLLDEQGKTEKYLAKLVKRLPVYEWVKDVSGLGDVSFSAIVGECAAPVGEYKSPSAVWKRMGLAVIGGERQRRVAGEAAIEHGYNAERRAIMWNIGNGLIKAQVRQVKDVEGGDTGERVTLGEYGALYLERKAHEVPRVETAAHAHSRAKRYMEKRLLRNLWRAWRAIEPPTPIARAPAEIQEVR